MARRPPREDSAARLSALLGTPVGPPYRRTAGLADVPASRIEPRENRGRRRTPRFPEPPAVVLGRLGRPTSVEQPAESSTADDMDPAAHPAVGDAPIAPPARSLARGPGSAAVVVEPEAQRGEVSRAVARGAPGARPVRYPPLPPVLRPAFPSPHGPDAEPDTLPLDLGALRGDDPWAAFADPDADPDSDPVRPDPAEEAEPLHVPGGRPSWAARLAERWAPAAWRGARLDPGRASAVALVLVAAVAAVIAAVGVWSARPRPEPLPALPSVSLTEPTPTPQAPAAELVISVSGTVAHPGLLRVPDGTRVAEALEAAGGALPGTDLSTLNLARRVADGEQIAVGVPPAPDAAAAPEGGGSPAGERVDLNRATLEQLDGLPGIGPVTAQRILDWRAAHGRFARVDQLREIEGIGERRFAQLEGLVTV